VFEAGSECFVFFNLKLFGFGQLYFGQAQFGCIFYYAKVFKDYPAQHDVFLAD